MYQARTVRGSKIVEVVNAEGNVVTTRGTYQAARREADRLNDPKPAVPGAPNIGGAVRSDPKPAVPGAPHIGWI